jgi:acyl-CoA thioesterase I
MIGDEVTFFPMQKQNLIFKAYGKSMSFFNSFVVIVAIFWSFSTAQAVETLKIVALGDSLTAGYGLPPGQAFPVQLEKALLDKGYQVQVENAGVSGDTSTGGLQRLDWAIGNDVDIVLVELGANDALRGIKPSVTRENLDKIITNLKKREIPIFFTGMKAPPNMGKRYQDEFDGIFPDLAQKYDLAFYPFFLEGVAADLKLNQDDTIHPNREGVAVIVGNMLPSLTTFIDQYK